MSPLALSLRLLQAQPDERLVALARAGHEPAFEALVRRYHRQLLSYCRRIKTPEGSAEDILQQALMQAWRALASGVEVRDARAWLYRIVHNAAIGAARGLGEAPAELHRTVAAAGVEQLVEQRLAAREALAGIAALPELQREVMLETALEGRSHEEVAASLGLTSGSVRGLVYRARSTLRAAAAALLPGPLIEWAARQEPGRSSAVVDAVAGGGSAGVAGAVIKSGAIVTVAGALAGTAAVVVTHRAHHPPMPARAAAAQRAARSSRLIALAPDSQPSVVSRTPIVAVSVKSATSAAAHAVDRRVSLSTSGEHTDRQPSGERSGSSHRDDSRSHERPSSGSSDASRRDGPDSSGSGDEAAAATAVEGGDGTTQPISTAPTGTTGPSTGTTGSQGSE